MSCSIETSKLNRFIFFRTQLSTEKLNALKKKKSLCKRFYAFLNAVVGSQLRADVLKTTFFETRQLVFTGRILHEYDYNYARIYIHIILIIMICINY